MPQSDPIRVLLVEDNSAAARLSEAMLDEQGSGMFDVTHVWCLREALQKLEKATFDVVLLDLSLPDAHGLESVIQLQDQAPDMPVVVLTAIYDEALGVEAVHQGAQDYLVKGQVSNVLLARSLHYAIERKRSAVALQASEERYQLLFESAPDGYYINDLKGVFIDGNRAAEELVGYKREELIGKSFMNVKLLTPKQIPKAAALLAQSALGKPTGPTEFTLNRKDGSQSEVEIRTFPIKVDDKSVVLGIARDITERKQVEQAEREQHTLTEALRDTALALTGTLDLEEVLDLILTNAGHVVPHDRANIMLVESGIPHIVRSQDYAGRRLTESNNITSFWLSRFLYLSHATEKGQPIIISDTQKDPNWNDVPGPGWERSIICAPILLKEKLLGFINLGSATLGLFTATHTENLQTFAYQAAIAIHNAQLYERAQKLAVLEERQRLAHDLHDAVTQTIWSATLTTEVLPQIWERDPEEGRRRLKALHRLTQSALAEMRTLLLELRPKALSEVGLGSLLRQLATTTTSRTKVPTKVSVEGRASLPPNVQTALYRIAQEALNNIIHHAGASQVTVRLRHQPKQVELTIADDGCGFDPDHVSPGHMGMVIMRERAETINAALLVTSRVGQGTRIMVVWPGPQEEERL